MEKKINCENPERKDWSVCEEKDPYIADYEYQDSCIEHKDYWTPVFSYSEATGDIFREISKGRKFGDTYWFDKVYVQEKLKKLKSINKYNLADLEEKRRNTTPEKIELLKKFLEKVDQWEKVTNPNLIDRKTKKFVQPITPDCKDLNVKEVQIESIHLIRDIVKWGLDEIPLPEIQYEINDYVKKVRKTLEGLSKEGLL